MAGARVCNHTWPLIKSAFIIEFAIFRVDLASKNCKYFSPVLFECSLRTVQCILWILCAKKHVFVLFAHSAMHTLDSLRKKTDNHTKKGTYASF